VISDLLPGETYQVAVTAIDWGSPVPEAVPAESNPAASATWCVPLPSQDECCLGVVGNASGDAGDQVNMADIALIVDYLFISGRELGCWAEADIDQSGGASPGGDDISVADLSVLVDHLFVDGTPLPDCIGLH
jgi:hypothetical protein